MPRFRRHIADAADELPAQTVRRVMLRRVAALRASAATRLMLVMPLRVATLVHHGYAAHARCRHAELFRRRYATRHYAPLIFALLAAADAMPP